MIKRVPTALLTVTLLTSATPTWAVWPFATGGFIFSSPAIADLDGDGQLEIVFGSWDGKVYCTDIAGNQKWQNNIGGQIHSSPTLADVDDEPTTLEVLIGSGQGSLSGKLYVLNEDGTQLAAFSTSTTIDGSALVTDLEDDGLPEIIFAQTKYNPSPSASAFLYCTNLVYDGTAWAFSLRWQVDLHDGVLSKPAAADFDGDGVREIICAESGVSNFFIPDTGETVYCFDADGDQLWSFDTTRFNNYDCPTIADLDNDGPLEVLQSSSDGVLYCLNGLTGGLLWSFDTGGESILHTQAVADLQGRDDLLETVVASYSFSAGSNALFCVDYAGDELWHHSFVESPAYSSPAIGDLDGNGELEIVMGTEATGGTNPARVYAFDPQGNIVWQTDMPATVYSSPALADLDGDGALEIGVGCYDNKFYVLDNDGDLYSPPPVAFACDPAPWPSFHRDQRNTRFYPGLTLVGDYNYNGSVELADWASAVGCLTGPAAGPPAPCCGAFDSEVDDDVDLRDCAAIENAFTGP